MSLPGLKGTKLVELPYLRTQLQGQTEDSTILIVGERIANGGVLQTVMERPFNSIVCTDIDYVAEGSNLEKIIEEDERVSFVQGDYLSVQFNGPRFDYVVCISVLEHFGMNFGEHSSFDRLNIDGDDVIRWDHDLRGLNKMMKDGDTIIVTVPVGQPIMSGDINKNDMPMLRRYDLPRIKFINDMVQQNGFDISSMFFYSQDYTNWYETEEDVASPQQSHLHSPFSPNCIWAFTLEIR